MHRPVKTRTSSQGRSLAKASRPSPLKLSKSPSFGKSILSPSKAKRDSHIDTEDDLGDEMAGLPSYCAACEKQIINPHATFLYCSEACRRKDGTYVTPVSPDINGSPSPIFPGMEMDDEALPDIVPQISPTAQAFPTIGSISNADDSGADSSNNSEAAAYLSQFLTMGHSPSSRSRGVYYRNKSASSQSTLPSLSHSHSSVGTNMSSYNSIARTAPQKLTPWGHRHSVHTFELAVPSGLNNSFSGRSISSVETAFKVADGEMTYEKRPMAPTPVNSPAAGSLKQLFAHEAMIRPHKSSASLAKMH